MASSKGDTRLKCPRTVASIMVDYSNVHRPLRFFSQQTSHEAKKTNVKAPENPPPHRFRIRMGIPVLHEMLQDFLRIIRHRDPSQCIGTSRWCECNHPDGDIFQQRTSCVYPRLQSLCAKLSIQDEVQLVRIVVILMEVFSNSKTHTKPKNET